MFEITTKWIKYFRRLRLERILANCTECTRLVTEILNHRNAAIWSLNLLVAITFTR